MLEMQDRRESLVYQGSGRVLKEFWEVARVLTSPQLLKLHNLFNDGAWVMPWADYLTRRSQIAVVIKDGRDELDFQAKYNEPSQACLKNLKH